MDRRQFLIGLFGTAAVIAAGPIPQAVLTAPEMDFTKLIEAQFEIYSNNLGAYGFAAIKWLDKAPWIEVIPPEDMYPMRAESDKIAEREIARMRIEYAKNFKA